MMEDFPERLFETGPAEMVEISKIECALAPSLALECCDGL